MSHLIASCLGFLLIISGFCHGEPPAQKGPWSVKLTTSGGFGGIGAGNISVDSDGRFDYSAPQPPQQVRTGCKGTLSAKQLQPVSEAVAQAKPQEWKLSELKAPDAFGYKLELRLGSNTQPATVQWYDNTKDKLPSDLKRLSDVLMQTMKTACHPGAP